MRRANTQHWSNTTPYFGIGLPVPWPVGQDGLPALGPQAQMDGQSRLAPTGQPALAAVHGALTPAPSQVRAGQESGLRPPQECQVIS
jgi:hypothetical protein